MQLEHGPDFSPQHEFHLKVQSVFGDFSGRTGFDGGARLGEIAVLYAAIYFAEPAGAVQPQAPRGR